MILSLKIKEECLLGFIHSRITGLAGRVETGISIMSKENINKLSVFETELRSVLDKNTLENINKKIETAPIIIANMYHDNYTKLLDCLEKEVKEGDLIKIRKNQIDYQIKVLQIPKSRIGAKLVPLHIVDRTEKDQYEILKQRKLEQKIRVKSCCAFTKKGY